MPKPLVVLGELGEGSMTQNRLAEAREALAILNQYFDEFPEDWGSPVRGSPASARSRQLRKLANDHLRSCVLRKEVLGAELSSEYCWAILVALYLSRCDGSRMCVTDIVYATGIPTATVIRWPALR